MNIQVAFHISVQMDATLLGVVAFLCTKLKVWTLQRGDLLFSCTHQGSLISMEILTNWTQVTTRR